MLSCRRPPEAHKTKKNKTTGNCIVKGTSEGDLPKACLEQEVWDTKQEHKVLICPHYQVKVEISWGGFRASSHFMWHDAGAGLFENNSPKFTPQRFCSCTRYFRSFNSDFEVDKRHLSRAQTSMTNCFFLFLTLLYLLSSIKNPWLVQTALTLPKIVTLA